MSAQRDEALHAKLDDFIDVQRTGNEAQNKHNEAVIKRVGTVEIEVARQDERLSQMRNIFGGIQLMFGGLLAWLGLR